MHLINVSMCLTHNPATSIDAGLVQIEASHTSTQPNLYVPDWLMNIKQNHATIKIPNDLSCFIQVWMSFLINLYVSLLMYSISGQRQEIDVIRNIANHRSTRIMAARRKTKQCIWFCGKTGFSTGFSPRQNSLCKCRVKCNGNTTICRRRHKRQESWINQQRHRAKNVCLIYSIIKFLALKGLLLAENTEKFLAATPCRLADIFEQEYAIRWQNCLL